MDYIVVGGQSLAALMEKAPALAPERLDQVAALPLGARVVMDPWSDRLDLIRTQTVTLVSAREKVPLAITPLMPVIRYAAAPSQTSAK